MSTILSGYRLTVDSWENDGDVRVTKVIDALSLKTVVFYVAILKLLGGDSEFSNMYEPDEGVSEKFGAALQKIAMVHNRREYSFEENDEEHAAEQFFDILYDMGLSGTSDFYTRVVESYTVEYVPEDIVLQDVTKEFK